MRLGRRARHTTMSEIKEKGIRRNLHKLIGPRFIHLVKKSKKVILQIGKIKKRNGTNVYICKQADNSHYFTIG